VVRESGTEGFAKNRCKTLWNWERSSGLSGRDLPSELPRKSWISGWLGAIGGHLQKVQRADRLAPNWAHLRAMLIQGVLEHWINLKFCANANCAAPYFIAKRKDQTVCDAQICKLEKQRAHALKWWHGNRTKTSNPQKP
jgi:hypothetical protein